MYISVCISVPKDLIKANKKITEMWNSIVTTNMAIDTTHEKRKVRRGSVMKGTPGMGNLLPTISRRIQKLQAIRLLSLECLDVVI